MIARVNGEEWGRGNSREMRWKFEDCTHVSRDETIYPREFFGSGTVGNGCGLEHLALVRDLDVKVPLYFMCGDLDDATTFRVGVFDSVRKQFVDQEA